jgi:hypothetical protein
MSRDIEKLLEELYKLSGKQRAALIQTARGFKKDQEFLRDFPDIEVAAVIWHVVDQSNGVSADEWGVKVVSYFIDQSLERLLAQSQIVMRKDLDGEERFFAVEKNKVYFYASLHPESAHRR